MTKRDHSEQHAAFVAAAKALECDEDKAHFEAQLGKIAAAKPAKDESPSPKKTKGTKKRA